MGLSKQLKIDSLLTSKATVSTQNDLNLLSLNKRYGELALLEEQVEFRCQGKEIITVTTIEQINELRAYQKNLKGSIS